jgi:alpha-tubulin suppressor-like RCC1 family protein
MDRYKTLVPGATHRARMQIGRIAVVGVGLASLAPTCSTQATAVSVGLDESCAVISGGTVKCWGGNFDGDLGDGSTTSTPLPTTVVNLPGSVTSIFSGFYFGCALLSGGGVACWGNDDSGQLGNGTFGQPQTTPVSVLGLSNATSIPSSSRGAHVCVLTSVGKVECWGENSFGELGDGSTTNRSTPVTVVEGQGEYPFAIATGGDHSCLLATYLDAPISNACLPGQCPQGFARCWGRNTFGQLGDGTTDDKHTPVPVVGGALYTAISGGANHTCALLADGRVQCWGFNFYGQLGDGTNMDRVTPVTVQGLGGAVISLAAGSEHTCAIVSGGQVQCWGENDAGQLGDGTNTTRLTPVTVPGLTGVTAIGAGYQTTCALLSSGQVQCWGNGDQGQLGDGVDGSSSTPVPVLMQL